MTAPQWSPHRLTASLATGLLALALAAGVWLALRTWPAATATACTFARPQPPGAVTFAPTVEPPTGAPTEAPAATASAAPTEALSAADIDFATQYAAAATAVIVRATQAPFATAQPVAVQPGQPSVITARRDGLALQVRLPKDAYLNGEAGWADATLSNAGPDTLFVEGFGALFGTTLLDAHGHQPPPWPWAPFSGPGGFPYLVSLNPGQSVTGTVVFHIAGPEAEYAFWVDTQFSRAQPGDLQGADNIWLHLEAGPLPLRVMAPAPSQKLQAVLQVDRLTWSLRVTDAAGQVPAGPFVGELEAASANGYSRWGPLASRPDGEWSMGWGDEHFGPGPFMVRAWVAAPGYVSAAVTQTVGRPADAVTLIFAGHPPDQRTYATLAAAQASLGISLYRLAAAPDSIQAEIGASSDFCSITTRQGYRLPGGARLELAQFYANPAYENAGWGEARYDAEAQRLSAGGQPAYLIQRLGWWTLDWKVGDDGFELRAPVDSLSSADLLRLAESVGH